MLFEKSGLYKNEGVVEGSDDIRSQLNGFVYFHNVVGTAPQTLIAMMSIYSGEDYKGGSIQQTYKDMKTNSLFTDFEELGYETEMLGYKPPECLAGKCYRRSHILRGSSLDTGIQKSYFQLLDASWLRVSPTFLHDWIYNNGTGRWSIIALIGPTGHSLQSVVTMQIIADQIEAVPKGPTLKFLHLMMTHKPVNLDENCSAKSRSSAVCVVLLSSSMHLKTRGSTIRQPLFFFLTMAPHFPD